MCVIDLKPPSNKLCFSPFCKMLVNGGTLHEAGYDAYAAGYSKNSSYFSLNLKNISLSVIYLHLSYRSSALFYLFLCDIMFLCCYLVCHFHTPPLSCVCTLSTLSMLLTSKEKFFCIFWNNQYIFLKLSIYWNSP